MPSTSLSSFAQTRPIFHPTNTKPKIALPIHPLTISIPPDFAQTCSPFPSPTLHTRRPARSRPPITRPIIISTPPSDDNAWRYLDDPISPLRFSMPPPSSSPPAALWNPRVPCFHPTAGNDEIENEYEYESNDGELEIAHSTHSADYVDLGNRDRDREGAGERRYSLPGDVRVLRREIGRLEGRVWVGGIRVEGRVWRWLRACEEAEREAEREGEGEGE